MLLAGLGERCMICLVLCTTVRLSFLVCIASTGVIINALTKTLYWRSWDAGSVKPQCLLRDASTYAAQLAAIDKRH